MDFRSYSIAQRVAQRVERFRDMAAAFSDTAVVSAISNHPGSKIKVRFSTIVNMHCLDCRRHAKS